MPSELTIVEKQKRFHGSEQDVLRLYVIHRFTLASYGKPSRWTACNKPNKFWDAYGKIFMNSSCYIALLKRFEEQIAKKRTHWMKKKVLFYQDTTDRHDPNQ